MAGFRGHAGRMMLAGGIVALLATACGSGGDGDPATAATAGTAAAGSDQATTAAPSAPGGLSPSTTAAASPSSSARPAPGSAAPTGKASAAAAGPGTPPPTGVPWDYQIGGAYPPPPGVGIVSRDRTASPAPGVYTICYVNTFQAQPDAVDWWQHNHPDLLLHAADGSLVVDQDWNEPLLDVSTAAKRAQLAAVEDAWIDGCAHSRFQAVEADNLDSYHRSNGLLTLDDDAAFATMLASRAHLDGLAFGQKNTTELLGRARQIGFDFAVAEQCGQYGECGQYAAAFANHVVDVEYDDQGFAAACQGWGKRIAVVRRDQGVSAAGSTGYVYKSC